MDTASTSSSLSFHPEVELGTPSDGPLRTQSSAVPTPLPSTPTAEVPEGTMRHDHGTGATAHTAHTHGHDDDEAEEARLQFHLTWGADGTLDPGSDVDEEDEDEAEVQGPSAAHVSVPPSATASRRQSLSRPGPPSNAPSTPPETEHHTKGHIARRRARPEEEVQVDALADYLTGGLRGVHYGHGVLALLLFLAMTTAAVLVSVMDPAARGRVAGAADVARFAAFKKCRSFADVGSVAGRVFAAADPSASPSDTVFVGAVSLRLYRGVAASCADEASGLLSPVDAVAAAECVVDGKDTPNTTAAMAVASGGIDTTSLWAGRQTAGRLRPYAPLHDAVAGWNTVQLTVPLPASSASAVLVKNASDAAAVLLGAVPSFLPDTGLAVGLDAVLAHRDSAAFTAVSVLCEVGGAAFVCSTRATPFRVRQLAVAPTPASWVAAAGDAAVLLLLAALVTEALLDTRLQLRLSDGEPLQRHPTWAPSDADVVSGDVPPRPLLLRVLTWWLAVDVAMAAACAVYCVLAALLWADGARWASGHQGGGGGARGGGAELEVLLGLQRDRERLERFLAWLTAVGYVRLFKYTASSDRLALLNLTMAAAVHDAVGVFVVLALVVVSYAYAGVLLWGPHVPTEHFGDFFAAAVFLFRFVLDGNGVYADFRAVDSLSSTLYFGTFFFAVWLLLLNVVVGVVALAFAAYVDMTMLAQRFEWSPVAVFRDARRWLRRAWPGRLCGGPDGDYAAHRLTLLQHVRGWQHQGVENYVSGPQFISLARLLASTRHSLPEPFVRHAFTKAQQQHGNPSALERKLRFLHRAANRGVVTAARLRHQAPLVTALWRKVCVQKQGAAAAARRLQLLSAAAPEFGVMRREGDAALQRLRLSDATATAESAAVRKHVAKLRRAGRIAEAIAARLRNGPSLTSPPAAAPVVDAPSIASSPRSPGPGSGHAPPLGLRASALRPPAAVAASAVLPPICIPTPPPLAPPPTAAAEASRARRERALLQAMGRGDPRPATPESFAAAVRRMHDAARGVPVDPEQRAVAAVEHRARAALFRRCKAVWPVLGAEAWARCTAEAEESDAVRAVVADAARRWHEVNARDAARRAAADEARRDAEAAIEARRVALLQDESDRSSEAGASVASEGAVGDVRSGDIPGWGARSPDPFDDTPTEGVDTAPAPHTPLRSPLGLGSPLPPTDDRSAPRNPLLGTAPLQDAPAAVPEEEEDGEGGGEGEVGSGPSFSHRGSRVAAEQDTTLADAIARKTLAGRAAGDPFYAAAEPAVGPEEPQGWDHGLPRLDPAEAARRQLAEDRRSAAAAVARTRLFAPSARTR